MSQPNWEEINVPRGAYVSWGDHPGQHVTGYVTDFDPTGGTDFAGNVCAQLSVELTEPAASFNKAGERTDFPAGELVVINAGQVSLKRAVKAANPAPGDLVKITLENLVRVASGTVKEFGIKIARGARPAHKVEQFSGAQLTQAPAANPFAQAAPTQAPAANPFAAPAQPTARPPF